MACSNRQPTLKRTYYRSSFLLLVVIPLILVFVCAEVVVTFVEESSLGQQFYLVGGILALIIKTAFTFSNFGLAATMAVAIMILIILIYIVQNFVIHKFILKEGR